MKPQFSMIHATFQCYVVDTSFNEWRVGGACCAEYHRSSLDDEPYWSDLQVALLEFVRTPSSPNETIKRMFVRNLDTDLPICFRETARRQIESMAYEVLENDQREAEKFQGCGYDMMPDNQEN